MYIVNVSLGMEHYQNEERRFDNYDSAVDYYLKQQSLNPFVIKMYQELTPGNESTLLWKEFAEQFTISDLHTMQYALECEYGVSDELASKLQLFLDQLVNKK
ncbi:hypothetical protein [Niallia taxi]|uniref:hypothetical protein n=1 Tax=Niallia taxi TaxID=2499688 RepID=UPI003009BA80